MSDTTDIKQFEQDATAVLSHPTAVHNYTTIEKDVQPLITAFPEIVKETKAGYKTTEFWLTIVGSIGVATGTVPTPHDTKGFAVVALLALYNIARGLAKKGVPSIEPSPVAVAPAATDADVVAGAPE